MESKILFLGTGGDSIVVGKQLRASGGIILQIDDNQFHIDPGPGALIMAKNYGINLRNNTAVFVSHNHINHCNDLNAVIEAMTNGSLDKHGVAICNNTVYNGTSDYSPYLTDFHKGCTEKSISIDAGQRVGINEVEIKATSAIHSDPNTIGFKFITSKFTISYTSDTSYDKTIAHDYKNTDILILNVQYPGDLSKHHYLCSDDAVKLIQEVKPKLAIIQHFGIKMLNADPLNEARIIQRKTRIQTMAATDGLIVNPISYRKRR